MAPSRRSSPATADTGRSQRNVRKKTKIAEKTSTGPECGVSRNAARERSRVRSLRAAFGQLQRCLPAVPPDTKLSKLDVLVLATSYISHLSRLVLEDQLLHSDADFSLSDIFQLDDLALPEPETEARNPHWEKSYLHPVKKWPMRSRLYAGVEENDSASSSQSQPAQW